ncbi:MAG: hypothetical protein MI802_04960 [Desulfobacterales bacterium]|nr:hypothetical protein [Desulfobacterales bacterium]
MAAARVSAASFFLATFRDYLGIPSDKHRIIAHLTRDEFVTRSAASKAIEGKQIYGAQSS